MTAQQVLDKFRQHGADASYHYADDTGKEWQLGLAEENAALALFDTHPGLQEQMRKIAAGFLWSLKTRRP